MSDEFITTVHVFDSHTRVDLDEMIRFRDSLLMSAEELSVAAACLEDALAAATAMQKCEFEVGKIAADLAYAQRQL